MESTTEDNVKQMGGNKSGRTKASLRQAIEGELNENKVKEVKTKLKQLIVDLAAAKRVVAAKEEEIEALFEDYADVISE